MMKSWQERFGAEVVCMSGDVLELRVLLPPNDQTSALALAREHYVYCPDIVVQGTQTLEALAAERLRATTWFFWWD